MKKILGFDIETIPQIKELSSAQEEWLETRLKTTKEKISQKEEQEIRKKIMGTTPYLGEIICIGLGQLVDSNIKTKSIIGKEEKILKEFWEILEKLPTNVLFVSFNGLKFDVNFITMRSLHHNILPTNNYFLNTTKFRQHPHFDVMSWMSDWGYPSPTLDLACDLTGVASSKKGSIKAKDVAQAYQDGRISEIAAYCERDVKATIEVYLKLKNYVRI